MRKFALGLAGALTASAMAASVGYVDFDGAEVGLTSYTNSVYSYTGSGLGTNASQVTPPTASTVWVAGDSFWPMNRANVGPNNIGMPFTISDDSVAAAAGNTVLATDALGFAGQATTSGFFGVTDTVNPSNTGQLTATFTFNITGASNLAISLDAAAMGDFELADLFNFDYSIDGGPFLPLFTSSVDELGNTGYTMDSGSPVALDDPMSLNAILVNDTWQTFSAAIAGTGTSLAVRFTSITDGAEGFGFDNLTITPEPASLALLALGALAAIRRR